MPSRRHPLVRYRLVLIVGAHVAIVVSAYLGSFFLRFEFAPPDREWTAALRSLPLLLAVRFFFFQRHHLFSGWWQYVGLRDMVDIAKSVTSGSFVFVVLVALSGLHPGFPRSVFVLEWLLTLHFLGGARVLSRLAHRLLLRTGVEPRHRALIVGSGALAESLLRELDENPSEHLPVGVVDDHLHATARRLRNLPVLGGRDDLPTVLAHGEATEVLIAVPASEPEVIRRTIDDCRAAGVPFRLISSVQDAFGQSPVRDLPALDELYATEVPDLDEELVRPAFYQKTVLVIGAAGQMGGALATAIAAQQPRQLLLFDRNESPLYYLEVEFLRRLQMVPLVPLIGDLLDRTRLRQIFTTYSPEVVIHAAGYTREELLEVNADEIRRNNLEGTRAVLEEAAAAGVERLLLLSMDEESQNLFRCLHHAAESWITSGNPPHGGIFAALRFPSVLNSPGCAVTRLDRAFERDEPVSVPSTDARIRVLPLRTLVPLLLEACAMAEDRDVLAIEAGEPQALADVARTLRQMRNLPDSPLPVSATPRAHHHSPALGEPTEHPHIVRRRPPSDLAPCAARLLEGSSESSEEGDSRAEDLGRR